MPNRWQPIGTAPTDGRLVRLRRVYEGRTIVDRRGYFGNLTVTYGGCAYVSYGGIEYAEPEDVEYTDVWIDEDRCHLFPTPTHWKPDDGGEVGNPTKGAGLGVERAGLTRLFMFLTSFFS